MLSLLLQVAIISAAILIGNGYPLIACISLAVATATVCKIEMGRWPWQK